MVQMAATTSTSSTPRTTDELDNAERVSEVMHLLREGSNLGWPYTYWDPIKKAHLFAPEYGGDNRKRVDPDPYDKPVVAFPLTGRRSRWRSTRGRSFRRSIAEGCSWRSMAPGIARRAPSRLQRLLRALRRKGHAARRLRAVRDGFPASRSSPNTRDARIPPGRRCDGTRRLTLHRRDRKGSDLAGIYTGETTPRARPASVASLQTPAPVEPTRRAAASTAGLRGLSHANGSAVRACNRRSPGSSVVAGEQTG
jgi:hypothetical protein